MAEFFKDANEMSKAIMGMFDKVKEDEVLVQKYCAVPKLTLYRYTDLGLAVWLDTRGGTFKYGTGEPGEKPNLLMEMVADDGHRAWQEKLNVVMWISRKKIKLEGTITDMMALGPLQKKFTAAYLETLKEIGREDFILK
jgi:hypothetical protein